MATSEMRLISDANSLVGMLESAHGWRFTVPRMGRSSKQFVDDFFHHVNELGDDLDEIVINHSTELPLRVNAQILSLQQHGVDVYATMQIDRHKGVDGRDPFKIVTVVISVKKQSAPQSAHASARAN